MPKGAIFQSTHKNVPSKAQAKPPDHMGLTKCEEPIECHIKAKASTRVTFNNILKKWLNMYTTLISKPTTKVNKIKILGRRS